MVYFLDLEKVEADKKLITAVSNSDISKILLKAYEELTKCRDPSNYLLLPENKEHLDLVVPLNRLSYDLEVEEIAKKLNLNLRNNTHEYIGNINFEPAKRLALGLNGFMNTPSIFAEYLKELLSGKAKDGSGKELSKSRADQAFKEKISWGNEWLNHKYFQRNSEMFVTYTRFSHGKLEEVTEQLDPDTLMEDKTPGINLEDWIINPTTQGLPRKSVQKGSLCYQYPRENRVARFSVLAFNPFLRCVEYPQDSNSWLGVSVVREKSK